MTKKDYERAARIAQSKEHARAGTEHWHAVIEAFVALFRADGNPRFDEARFRAACVPGANVRARPRKPQMKRTKDQEQRFLDAQHYDFPERE